MVRRNFYDLLESLELNVPKEYSSLIDLFFNEQMAWSGTLANFVDTFFRDLEFRGTFTNIREMYEEILPPFYCSDEIDDLFLLCEFLLAVLPAERIDEYSYTKKQAVTIIHNIKAICEKTNHEIKKDEKGRFIIIEKNPEATQAAELVEDESTAIKILEYNHFSLKGDIESKHNILVTLGQYLEPMLKEHKLRENGYLQLESDIGFLLNNFNIRHNNKEGTSSQKYIVSIDDDTLEEWYDKTYNCILAAIILEEQISISKEISDVKKAYTWR